MTFELWMVVATFVGLAIGLVVLALLLQLRIVVNHVLAILAVEVQAQAAEQQAVRQRRNPIHQVGPPVRVEGGWQGRCSCGFDTDVWPDGTLALDELQAHKRLMPAVRRTG